MLTNYSVVLVFLIVAILFILVSLFIGKLIRPIKPNPIKNSTYECGEEPIGGGWLNFNIRFYIIALIFIIFDVEIAFIIPVAVIFRDWVSQGIGLLAFIELLVFIGILFLGLVYVWQKGDLDWVRGFVKGGKESILTFEKELKKLQK